MATCQCQLQHVTRSQRSDDQSGRCIRYVVQACFQQLERVAVLGAVVLRGLVVDVIRWHLDSGLVVIPKSVTPARIAENFNVWDFRLDKDELDEIAKLDQGKRLGPDPDQFGG